MHVVITCPHKSIPLPFDCCKWRAAVRSPDRINGAVYHGNGHAKPFTDHGMDDLPLVSDRIVAVVERKMK